MRVYRPYDQAYHHWIKVNKTNIKAVLADLVQTVTNVLCSFTYFLTIIIIPGCGVVFYVLYVTVEVCEH